MTAYPGFNDPHAREQIAPERAPGSPDLRLLARIEGLLGEEQALLRIPAKERSPSEHSRLRELGAELDGVFERLRQRAERLGSLPHSR